ncbi:MAG: BatA domain-containing protein, partial [Ignavibacteria bacterium]|nr:BatA domain-containing protein [Ignavibacteria bacterium]
MKLDFTFANPYLLLLLVLIPLLLAWYFFRQRKSEPKISYSYFNLLIKKNTIRERLVKLPLGLKLLALLCFIIAAARPQSFSSGEKTYTEGIDITLVLDISGSMLAEDFKPNRLEASKRITDNFISGRTSDQIGLVIFSREAFTQC